MLSTFQNAVDAAVEQAASENSVLDVNARTVRILGPSFAADADVYDQVALALIKAASRRSVAMTFCNPHA